VVDQRDGSGFRRRHHAEHGHNRTIQLGPFHKAASPSLGIFGVNRIDRGHVGEFFRLTTRPDPGEEIGRADCDARRFVQDKSDVDTASL
jgi:hypothetical protein